MNGCSVVLVIAPLSRLSSIIDDQITALKSSGYPAADVKCLQHEDLERFDFKVLFSSAENVLLNNEISRPPSRSSIRLIRASLASLLHCGG